MPPKKVPQVTGEDGTPLKEKGDGVNVEDLALPRTMVQRLAKGVLPANTQIQKDAITAFSKSATVFVSFLSHHANQRAILANRKTISPNNVLEALSDCEFDMFLPRVEAELKKFNEIQTGKRNEYRRRLKEGKDGKESSKQDKEAGNADREDGDEGEERAAKRMRRGSDDSLRGPGPEGQLVERPKGKEVDRSMDGADETTVEGDTREAGEDEADEQGDGGDEDVEEEDQEEEYEYEDKEDEEEDHYDVEDMDLRLRNLQAGMSSSSNSRAPSPTSNYGRDEDDDESD